MRPGYIIGGIAALIVIIVIAAVCLTGGDEAPPSVARPGSIPTATPPNPLPEAIVIGEAQAGGGTGGATGSGTSAQAYVIRSGDTLSSIASSLGVPAEQQSAWIAEVVRLNNIQDVRLLQAGQELRLPAAQATPRATGTPTRTPTPGGAATAPTATPPAGTATPRPTVAGGGGTYTVVSGDNPHVIAEKLGVPEAERAAWAEQLLRLNNVSATALQPGQVLQLPAGTPGAGATATPTRTP
jgi:LysM repeat protein